MFDLTGKRGLIMGVANDRSIAWGIASAMAEAGADLAFTYQGEAFGKRVEPLAASVDSTLLVDVDVSDDASLDAAFARLAVEWETIDFLVHAIAFSDKAELARLIPRLQTIDSNLKFYFDNPIADSNDERFAITNDGRVILFNNIKNTLGSFGNWSFIKIK